MLYPPASTARYAGFHVVHRPCARASPPLPRRCRTIIPHGTRRLESFLRRSGLEIGDICRSSFALGGVALRIRSSFSLRSHSGCALPSCILTWEPNYSFIDDSFLASWTTDDSNFWPHGRDRTSRRGIHSGKQISIAGVGNCRTTVEQERRDERAKDRFLIIGIAGLAGLVGARLYLSWRVRTNLIANPSVLISRFGFAWFGGLLGGFVALVILQSAFAFLCSNS